MFNYCPVLCHMLHVHKTVTIAAGKLSSMLLDDLQQILLLSLILCGGVEHLYKSNTSLSNIINTSHIVYHNCSFLVRIRLWPVMNWYVQKTVINTGCVEETAFSSAMLLGSVFSR